MYKIFNKIVFLQSLRSLTPSNRIFIAYSGGVDSHVLLNILAELRENIPELQLTAIHINHNLSDNAVKWQEHCRKVCTTLNISYLTAIVDAKIKVENHSPEEVARKLRYAALGAILPEGAVLLTAHHADDQAETLLLQLFRGAGPKGLGGMSAKAPFYKGFLLRPFLPFSRAQLLQYAQTKKLAWVNDESNFNVSYARNFLRHKVLPILQKNWPGIVTAVNRAAQHNAEADELLQLLAADDLMKVLGSIANTLSIPKLLELGASRQKNVIRFWLQKNNFPLPSTTKLMQIEKTVLGCRYDATPVVTWDDVEIRRYQNNLYALYRLKPHDNTTVLAWDLQKPLLLASGLGVLSAKIVDATFNIDYTKISVRFRQGGEVCQIAHRRGTHELRKLFQEWKVPPWMRNRIPLIYYEDKIVAVVGFGSSNGWSEAIIFAQN